MSRHRPPPRWSYDLEKAVLLSCDGEVLTDLEGLAELEKQIGTITGEKETLTTEKATLQAQQEALNKEKAQLVLEAAKLAEEKEELMAKVSDSQTEIVDLKGKMEATTKSSGGSMANVYGFLPALVGSFLAVTAVFIS